MFSINSCGSTNKSNSSKYHVKMFKQSFLLLLVILAVVKNSLGHSTGADPAACTNLTPMHGTFSPQTSPVPATIVSESGSHVASNQLVTLTLRANPGTTFRGFMVQARRSDISQAVGDFQVSGGDMRILSCPNFPTATATHTNNLEKNVVQLQWRAPVVPAGQRIIVNFYYSIVQSYDMFWASWRSAALIVGT